VGPGCRTEDGARERAERASAERRAVSGLRWSGPRERERRRGVALHATAAVPVLAGLRVEAGRGVLDLALA